MNKNYTWELMGSLDSPTFKSGGGVYLLIFKGKPKRVIYVGTTQSFNKRIDQHRIGMLEGKRTVWRAGSDKDIYELMSFKDEGNPYKYYHSLAKKNLLWATTTIKKEVASNDLLKKDSFEENWREFVHDHYIKNIEVWICRTDDSQSTNKRIESQIQTALKNNYSIGSHIHKINSSEMCWLGKIEYGEEVFSTQYTFGNSPDISEEFEKILHNLSSQNFINYRKPHKVKEAASKAEELKAIREQHQYSKTSWHRKEDQLIHRCLELNMTEDEIAGYLQRTPEEISQRVKYLSKYYKLGGV